MKAGAHKQNFMTTEPLPAQASPAQAYSAAERAALYRAIDERRDMRHFAGGGLARKQALLALEGRAQQQDLHGI